MDRSLWSFLIGLWASVTVGVAILPLLFAPAVFRPALAAGAVLGVAAVGGVLLSGSADRLRTRLVKWCETSGRTGLLVNGVLSGCVFVVWMALLTPLIDGDPVTSSDYVGLQALVPLLFFSVFNALVAWVSEKYADRVRINEAPDPP